MWWNCVFVPIFIAIYGFNRFCSVSKNTIHTYIPLKSIVTFGSNFTSSRWNQWISRVRRNMSHSSFAIRMQLIWKPRFRTFRWYSFRRVFPIFYGFKIDYYSNFDFFQTVPDWIFLWKLYHLKAEIFSFQVQLEIRN